ncbi:MAG TPA: hypothetical protein VEH06_13505 [Candidatus Bathyarchaeia archaeon]|nr:hypothetical protein [Candidatus Bathyarchaeia archaeon]
MTTIKNQKKALGIVAIAAVIAVSTVALGNGRVALADTTTITKHTNNTGVNVPTDTDQKQNCETAGGSSGIAMSCTANSNDQVTESGGIK